MGDDGFLIELALIGLLILLNGFFAGAEIAVGSARTARLLLLVQILLLDRNDAFVALVFGVFIDLDHFFGLRDYAQTNGIKAVFDLDSILNPGVIGNP